MLFSPTSNPSNMNKNSGCAGMSAFQNTPLLTTLKGLEYLTVQVNAEGSGYRETAY